MNIDFAILSGRLKCSDEEKRECLETVKIIVRAYCTAYKEGILALEFMEEFERDPFFHDCVEYGLYCSTPELYEAALKCMLAAGDYRGKELLNNILICEGMTVIFERSKSPEECGLWRLAPYFGAGWHESVMKTIADERSHFKKQ